MLNRKQNQAVNSDSKRILCLAGAGTGKTMTLISRVKSLLELGVSPSEILCLTFTRLAGMEMKERLEEKGKDIFINTFHSFCSLVIKENLSLFGLRENYTIYDQKKRESIIKDAVIRLKMEKENIKLDVIVDCIFNPNADYKDTPHRRAKIIAKEYRYILRCENAIDIDLLILDVVDAFKFNEDLCRKYHDRYKYIFIDEAQDTNDYQMSFINSINPEHLFIVGDDYQAIYGFAGAKVEYILKIAQNPQFEVIKLEENYRSTTQIVAAANNIISHNTTKTDKDLVALKEGDVISYNEYENFTEEILGAINEIKSKGRSFDDFCLITRTNSQIAQIKAIFKSKGIPFKVLGEKQPMLEHEETLEILNLIELTKNPLDNDLFMKFLSKYIDEDTLEEIVITALNDDVSVYETVLEMEDLTEDNESIGEFLEFIEECNIEEIYTFSAIDCLYNLLQKDFISKYNQTNLNQLVSFIQSWDKVQRKFREDYSMDSFNRWFKFKDLSDIELILKEERGQGVNITTAHSSKGLEFPVVFIVGMNEGIFPHKRDELEEARRLCFVAITRAKEKLFVSWSKTYVESWSKKLVPIGQSIFIDEMKKGI